MDVDVAKLKEDAGSGRVNVDQAVKVCVKLVGTIQRLEAEIEELKRKLAEKNPTPRVNESYSVGAEEKRQEKRTGKRRKRKKPERSGRVKTEEKLKLATVHEDVYPALDVPEEQCVYSHTRFAWRLIEGRAVGVAYRIFRHGKVYGIPDGLTGRTEFGIEISIALAYQVHILGLSLDKACSVLGFFQNLKLSKSQSLCLLRQLARIWEREFETLCCLLAHSAVVHCDETSWSIKSLWAFLNDRYVVLFYGVNKDGETLAQILDKEFFNGLLNSDNAAVYQGFNRAQKCWAHLLRKAIKLTLLAPNVTQYREFADELLEIYREAKRICQDQRYGREGREQKVRELDDRVLSLCDRLKKPSPHQETADDFRRLREEVLGLMMNQELFVFVVEQSEGTNNAAEREIRDDTTARATGRASKTLVGAKQRSIINSVLRSLGKQLEAFTLENVLKEVKNWTIRGRSCFQRQFEKLKGKKRKALDQLRGILDRVIFGKTAETSPEPT